MIMIEPPLHFEVPMEMEHWVTEYLVGEDKGYQTKLKSIISICLNS